MGTKRKTKSARSHAGELRRFECITGNPEEIMALNDLIAKKGLTRKDIARILLALRVRPGIVLTEFDI